MTPESPPYASPPPFLVKTQGITKSYGFRRVFQNLDLEVPQGALFGLLGPNGSGKTTLLSILLGLIHPDSGQVQWGGGLRGASLRKSVGAFIETPNFYPNLSAWDNLGLVQKIRGLKEEDRDRVLQIMGLQDRKKDAFQTYSLGMKQRLGLAATLLGSPKILVLDEPTHGMDPAGIRATRDLLLDLHHSGTSIILASHLLAEVEKLCTHIAVLYQGQIKAQGAISSLVPEGKQILIKGPNLSGLYQVLSEWPALISVQRNQEGIVVQFLPPITAAAINQYCLDHDQEISLLQPLGADLESLYLELTRPSP